MRRIRIKIQDHQIVANKQRLQNEILFLEDGEYAIDVKKWDGSKTWKQIKTIKGVLIPKISEYTGESKKEVQRRLKIDYGVCEWFERDGQRCVEVASFSAYSKSEMRDFITAVLQHCEEDLEFIIDLELRKQLLFDEETGELTEHNP